MYEELHRLAHYHLKRERAGHSLQTTALVNEAYMRLVDYKRMQWQNRAHFMAAAAQAMRRILVDHARRRNAKRGANAEHVSLVERVGAGGMGVLYKAEDTRLGRPVVLKFVSDELSREPEALDSCRMNSERETPRS